jgi:hypothetical protein
LFGGGFDKRLLVVELVVEFDEGLVVAEVVEFETEALLEFDVVDFDVEFVEIVVAIEDFEIIETEKGVLAF